MANDSRHEALNQLLEDLDAKGRWRDGVCHRRRPRRAFRTDCTVRFIPPDCHEVVSLPGRTRNLSRAGLALLVRHVFTVGEPLEVQLEIPGRPTTFLAGLVRFVRYAGRGYHELGMALQAAGSRPIFSHDPVTALATLDWVRCPKQLVR